VWEIAGGLLGFIVGGFLTGGLDGLAHGRSPLAPQPCPICGANLSFGERLWNRGGCGHASVGWRVLPALGAVAIGILSPILAGPGIRGLFVAQSLWVLWTVSLTDIRERRIPDVVLLFGLLAASAVLAFSPNPLWVTRLEGFGVLFAITFTIALVSKGGMGGGDVKLAAYTGYLLGLAPGLTALLVGAFMGGLYGLGLVVLRKGSLRDQFAFGPFLAAGAVIFLLLKTAGGP